MANPTAARDGATSSAEVAFGRVLRRVRASRKMSQQELAVRSGYHRNFIGLLEQGKRSPSLRTIFNIATVLAVKPSLVIRRVERMITRTDER